MCVLYLFLSYYSIYCALCPTQGPDISKVNKCYTYKALISYCFFLDLKRD